MHGISTYYWGGMLWHGMAWYDAMRCHVGTLHHGRCARQDAESHAKEALATFKEAEDKKMMATAADFQGGTGFHARTQPKSPAKRHLLLLARKGAPEDGPRETEVGVGFHCTTCYLIALHCVELHRL